MDRYAIFDENGVILVIMPLPLEDVRMASMAAALKSNYTIIEVPTNNMADIGWTFNGTDYIPPQE